MGCWGPNTDHSDTFGGFNLVPCPSYESLPLHVFVYSRISLYLDVFHFISVFGGCVFVWSCLLKAAEK